MTTSMNTIVPQKVNTGKFHIFIVEKKNEEKAKTERLKRWETFVKI